MCHFWGGARTTRWSNPSISGKNSSTLGTNPSTYHALVQFGEGRVGGVDLALRQSRSSRLGDYSQVDILGVWYTLVNFWGTLGGSEYHTLFQFGEGHVGGVDLSPPGKAPLCRRLRLPERAEIDRFLYNSQSPSCKKSTASHSASRMSTIWGGARTTRWSSSERGAFGASILRSRRASSLSRSCFTSTACKRIIS